jgi:hypothetical protein
MACYIDFSVWRTAQVCIKVTVSNVYEHLFLFYCELNVTNNLILNLNDHFLFVLDFTLEDLSSSVLIFSI